MSFTNRIPPLNQRPTPPRGAEEGGGQATDVVNSLTPTCGRKQQQPGTLEQSRGGSSDSVHTDHGHWRWEGLHEALGHHVARCLQVELSAPAAPPRIQTYSSPGCPDTAQSAVCVNHTVQPAHRELCPRRRDSALPAPLPCTSRIRGGGLQSPKGFGGWGGVHRNKTGSRLAFCNSSVNLSHGIGLANVRVLQHRSSSNREVGADGPSAQIPERRGSCSLSSSLPSALSSRCSWTSRDLDLAGKSQLGTRSSLL